MKQPDTPVLLGLGWSADHTAAFSAGIRYLTRPGLNPFGPWADWSHMFLVFKHADDRTVIHEALMSEGWRQKDGRKLVQWAKRDPKNHRYTVKWLPVDEEHVALVYQASCAWLGAKSYARRQILAFAIAESMLGRWLGLSVYQGPNEVICSEGACRLVGSFCPQWDLRRYPDQSWDSLSPQAAYNAWSWRHERSVDAIPPTGA
jgi:hypothetical protein